MRRVEEEKKERKKEERETAKKKGGRGRKYTWLIKYIYTVYILYNCIIYICSRYLDLSLYIIMVTCSCSGSLVCHFVDIPTIIILQVLGFHNFSVPCLM